jgi:hypothetical protein
MFCQGLDWIDHRAGKHILLYNEKLKTRRDSVRRMLPQPGMQELPTHARWRVQAPPDFVIPRATNSKGGPISLTMKFSKRTYEFVRLTDTQMQESSDTRPFFK